jgi:DNA sulfur modification protein DndD
MRIDKITLSNFRQYEGSNIIDLSTTGDKNIVLIGGKNGYGKTNFLMSIVWCFYGEDIAKIDENYKREIQKEGNYIKFLKSSLNWSSAKKGEDNFYVEIQLSEIELPDTLEIKSGSNYR